MSFYQINETHDPNLKSWLESANDPSTDFPLQNLPVCRFIHRNDLKIGIGIGDFVLDFEPYYNMFIAEGFEKKDLALAASHKVRKQIIEDFDVGAPSSRKNLISEHLLIPMTSCQFVLPFEIGDYTDFYCSIFHATNVGMMFRPENPLFPNYKWLPVGYHGRASSVVISGAKIKRPKGQSRADGGNSPVFAPCKNLDYEVEVGFFIGKGNELGKPIPLQKAEEHIFGLCLVNDWSARDIQAWEYQPLGPFLSKSFATTISPFIVTMEALAPFRVPAFERLEGDPKPLEYLYDETNQNYGGIDLNLEVYIRTQKMREERIEPHLLSRSNMKDLYWTIGQMVAHHSSNGCNLRVGDLIATGTVSGRSKSERGCLLELTWRGTEPIELPTGEIRRFLEDGDEIIIKGYCEREGFRRIGFGECRGMVLPAD
jgi:fumarylacetoacetase